MFCGPENKAKTCARAGAGDGGWKTCSISGNTVSSVNCLKGQPCRRKKIPLGQGTALIHGCGEREDIAILGESLAIVGPGLWWLGTIASSLPFPSSLPAAMLCKYVHDQNTKMT